jgi:hypothetical protein
VKLYAPAMLGRLRASPTSRFFVACALGGALATVVFAYFLLAGQADPFRRDFFTDFYDVQARSLLHGHWDVGARALAFERFRVDGKYYTYFGPWPALLRIPVLIFTDRLDGRLSRVSMLLAYMITLASVARLSWQARRFRRGEVRPSRGELALAAGFVFLIGCGSTVLFLGGRSWVYHEALLWGIAWSLAAYSFIVAYIIDPTRRNLACASATATLAVLSRATVGSGPILVLGLVLVARLALWARDRWRERRMPGEKGRGDDPWWLRLSGLGDRNRAWGQVAVATAVPVVLYAYVNYSKFGSLYRLPLEKQDIIAASPVAKAAFAANDGSITGLTYAPTNLLQYFRPEAIGFDRLFPWVTFSRPPRVIGGARFIDIDFSASIPASATLLFLLAVIGIVLVVRAPRPAPGRPTAAALRVPLAASLVAGGITLCIAYLQQRYEADFLPALVMAGAVAAWALPGLIPPRRAVRVLVGAAVVLVGAWSCWATASLTLLHQRAYGPLVSRTTLARLVDVQLAVYERVPGGSPSRVFRSAGLPLPAPAQRQSLLVVGDCAGLYYSTGRAWAPVELTPRTGIFALRVRFADAQSQSREPLLSATDDRGVSIVWVRHLPASRVRFEYQWIGDPARPIAVSSPIRVGRKPVDLSVRLDPSIGFFEIQEHGRSLVLDYTVIAQSAAVVGRQSVSADGAPRFAGTIQLAPTPTPVCHHLVRLGRA